MSHSHEYEDVGHLPQQYHPGSNVSALIRRIRGLLVSSFVRLSGNRMEYMQTLQSGSVMQCSRLMVSFWTSNAQLEYPPVPRSSLSLLHGVYKLSFPCFVAFRAKDEPHEFLFYCSFLLSKSQY